VQQVLAEDSNFDMIIHLGDYLRDAEDLENEYPNIKVEYVYGNCDFMVGDTPSEIPMRLGEPVTYLFPWRVSLAPGVTAYTFRIPVAECGLIDGEGVVFAAHADIRKGLFERDAWGQGNRFPWSRRGAMYFIVDCTNPKPPV
jgi:hypothetical protein